MQEVQNTHALAPVEGFEGVKRKLEARLRLWRTTVIAGAAIAALIPLAVVADEGQVGINAGGIPQQIQNVLATLATQTTQIASLQAGDTSQGGQLAALQHQLDTQSGQIVALQSQLRDESAARSAGDAAGKAYTDAETARATGAENALGASIAKIDGSSTLDAAKAYADAQVAAEAAARQSSDAALQANLNAETDRAKLAESNVVGPDHGYTDQQVAAEATARQSAIDAERARAQGAEAALLNAINAEIARATAGELAAFTKAVSTVETNLTTVARASTSVDNFLQNIKDGNFA